MWTTKLWFSASWTILGGLLLLSCEGQQTPQGPDRDLGCFQHRYLHGNKTYVFFFVPLSYKDAVQVCRATSGEMVAIRDEQTNNFITKLRSQVKLYGYWINIKDWEKQGDSELAVFSGWSNGLPKRGKSSAGKDRCPYLSVNLQLDWHDANCKTMSMPYVCQYGNETFVPGNNPRLPCMKDYGPCFEVIHTDTLRDDAEKDCKSKGGSLALIETKETHDFLKSIIFEKRKFLNTSETVSMVGEEIWGGMHIAARKFTYSDGTPVQYTNWADGEPNNWKGLKEDCVVVNTLWNDVECDGRRKYVCQYHKDVMSTSDCQGDFCYQYVDRSVTYNEAEQDCKRNLGTVAEVKSAETNALLASITLKKGNPVWIGVRSAARGFTYSDGTPLTYTNWADGEPNNWKNTEEDCVVIKPDTHKWNDVPCTGKSRFICEYETPNNLELYKALPTAEDTNTVQTSSTEVTSKSKIDSHELYSPTTSPTLSGYTRGEAQATTSKEPVQRTTANEVTLCSSTTNSSPQKESFRAEACQLDHQSELCLGKGQLAGILIGCTLLNLMWLTIIIVFFWFRQRRRPNKFDTLEEDNVEMFRSQS